MISLKPSSFETLNPSPPSTARLSRSLPTRHSVAFCCTCDEQRSVIRSKPHILRPLDLIHPGAAASHWPSQDPSTPMPDSMPTRDPNIPIPGTGRVGFGSLQEICCRHKCCAARQRSRRRRCLLPVVTGEASTTRCRGRRRRRSLLRIVQGGGGGGVYLESYKREARFGGGGGGGGGVYLESYTREARFLKRWDQHAVAQLRL